MIKETHHMKDEINRRKFLTYTGMGITGLFLTPKDPNWSLKYSMNTHNPHQYIIVEGHRDIWEFNDRLALRDRNQHSPLKDFLLPRLIEGGVDVVIMPAGGDSVPERGGDDKLLEGSLRVVDMLLMEIEKTGGKASIIKTKADIPKSTFKDHVKFFLDMEGGSSIQIDPEPEYHSDRRLALLRTFFRLGVRGMQLTHNGRNQLGDGIGEGKMAGKLSQFGVEVVEEMNRLGMMIGVSHLSANGIFHVAEITKKPIVSTHTNIQKFINTPRQHSDDELKAIASTKGVIGIRYIEGQTSYELLVDEIDYMRELMGIDHIGVGWLGHDIGHPKVGQVPGFTDEPPPGEVEKQSMLDHWSRFIGILEKRGYKEEEIAKILGGNFLRIWREILPENL
jgi:membrane dipeptidase